MIDLSNIKNLAELAAFLESQRTSENPFYFGGGKAGLGNPTPGGLLDLMCDMTVLQPLRFINTASANKVWHITGSGNDFAIVETGVAVQLTFKAGGDVYSQKGTWAPTYAGFSTPPSTVNARYTVVGKLCTVFVKINTNGVSNATTFTLTAPFTAATVAGMTWGSVFWSGGDNGAQLATPGRAWIGSASNIINLGKTIQADNTWTAALAKFAVFTLTYEIA